MVSENPLEIRVKKDSVGKKGIKEKKKESEKEEECKII